MIRCRQSFWPYSVCLQGSLCLFVYRLDIGTYYPAESLSWYSEALSKHAWMPVSFHNCRIISESSLGMVPSSIVSAKCISFLALSCRRKRQNKKHTQTAGHRVHSHACMYIQHPVTLIITRKLSDTSRRHLLGSVSVANVERVHSFYNSHDWLQGVAVDDGNELQALF